MHRHSACRCRCGSLVPHMHTRQSAQPQERGGRLRMLKLMPEQQHARSTPTRSTPMGYL